MVEVCTSGRAGLVRTVWAVASVVVYARLCNCDRGMPNAGELVQFVESGNCMAQVISAVDQVNQQGRARVWRFRVVAGMFKNAIPASAVAIVSMLSSWCMGVERWR